MLWESDWDLNDVEHSKYILNFGSNAFEAHQGHVSFATRIQNGRFKNGAKLVTFDVRLSNTAGSSDEWFAPFPGTDGAIALAMGHAIFAAGLEDRSFLDQWTNASCCGVEGASPSIHARVGRKSQWYTGSGYPPNCHRVCGDGSCLHHDV